MTQATIGGLTAEQVDVFARGLYWLANVDGIDDREVAVIDEFLRETGSDWSIDRIQVESFDPRELPAVLDTSFLRRLFLRCAVALVAADGVLSEAESHALHRSARVLGLSDVAYQDLEEEARRMTIPAAGRSSRKKPAASQKKSQKKTSQKKAKKKKKAGR